MTITAKHNKQIWFVIVGVFLVGITWNTYYAHYIADQAVMELELKNTAAENEIRRANRNVEFLKEYSQSLSKEVESQKRTLYEQDLRINSNASALEYRYINQKKLENEDNFINRNADAMQQLEFLSRRKYQPYVLLHRDTVE